MKMDELKPCPFCGKTPELLEDWDGKPYVACIEDDCNICVSTGNQSDASAAIAAWNERAPSPVPEPVRENLIEALKAMREHSWKEENEKTQAGTPEAS